MSSAQTPLDSLDTDFENFKDIPIENIHCQVNKSIYIPDEDIGFTAYIIDQNTGLPSLYSKNIYCQILNESDEIIKQKLIMADNSVATNVFAIDSAFTAGNYRLRAFTNWMKNFKKPLFAEVPFKIVATDFKFNNSFRNYKNYDLQVFPEGGHAINGVFTKVGVLLKDENGNGLSQKGSVYVNNEIYTTVQLDKNGLGNFLWLPEVNKEYVLKFDINGRTFNQTLPSVKKTGVTLTTAENSKYLVVAAKTNDLSLSEIPDANYTIVVSGRNRVDRFPLQILKTENILALPLDSIESGINKISMFNERGKVLCERLIFNYKGLSTITGPLSYVTRDLDSIDIRLDYKKKLNGSVSVSILPLESIAVQNSEHIMGKFELSPYIKGFIQDPGQYFERDDRRTKFKMDNLLLCQGWTKYDWNELTDLKNIQHAFENGISVRVKSNDRKKRKLDLLMMPSRNNSQQIISIEEGQEQFVMTGYFPTTKETLKLSKLDKKGKAGTAALYPNFYPSKFPDFSYPKVTPFIEMEKRIEELSFEPITSGDASILDTIVLNVEKNNKRNEKIANMSRGRVDFFDDEDRRRSINIFQYLRANGFNTYQENGLTVIRAQSGRVTNADPIIILDGVTYFDTNILLGFNMSIVDYIELDMSGLGGFAGISGVPVINIATDISLNPFKKKSRNFSSYKVPLTFSMSKKFYKPKYATYNSEFFNALGVLDWFGKLKMQDGKIDFRTPFLLKSKFLLIIEGMADDGTLVHEKKVVSISR